MKRRTVLGGLAAAAGLGLVGTTGCRPSGDAGVATLRTLQMVCDPWAGYYPAALAEADGDFAREGLSVTMARSTTTDRMLAEFHAGRFDVMSASLGDVIPIAARDLTLRIVLTTDESAGADMVFRRRGFDPSAATRLRIGTDFNGFGELFMRDYLAQAGLAERELQWLHVDAGEVGAALDAGQIDFGNCWEPYASEVLKAGHSKVFDSAQTPALVTQVLVCKRRLLVDERERMRGFCRAWFAAVDRWLADVPAGSARIEGVLGLPAGEGSLDGIRLHTLDDNRRLLGGDPPGLAAVLGRYADFYTKRGEAPGDLGFLFEDAVLP
jgi:NitT/TauT family transport system substrate-binding protein